jgi:hypothetical protein
MQAIPDQPEEDDEYLALLLTRLAAEGGAFAWLHDQAEDLYSDADSETAVITHIRSKQ